MSALLEKGEAGATGEWRLRFRDIATGRTKLYQSILLFKDTVSAANGQSNAE